MKNLRRMFALLLCVLLAVCFLGCQSAPAETTPPTTEPAPTDPPPTAQEIYAEAAQKLFDQEYVILSADITRTTTVGADEYTKTSQQQITWKGQGTDEMGAKVVDSSTVGDQTRRYSEVYRNGTVYLAGEGLAYVSESDAAAFERRWVGTAALDADNYETVTQEETAEGMTIYFDDATALEIWAAPDYAILQEASGSAKIGADGSVSAFTYSASFRQGGADITLEAQVTVQENRGLDLTLNYPENDDRYVYVSDPAIPWLLIEARDYLLQSESLISYATGSLSSEALNASCTTTVSVQASDIGEDHLSSIAEVVTVATDRYEDTYTWDHRFADGKYTMSYCDGTPEEDSSITAAGMRNTCLSLATSYYPPLGDITGATLTDFGSICLIEMDCSVALAQAYSNYLCEYLTSDSTLLNRLASSYKTTAMDFYVAVNRDTGLPTACGINFGGIHTIEGKPYSMTYRMNQTIHAGDPSVRETLTGEPLPEEEPEQKATPLLYRVTGTDGQQMWLMGTIHVGDERTGFLPQAVYDALDSSSALAVEFDTEAFAQMLAEDQDLATRVISSYFYMDGTTAADHLDPMIYGTASKLLKAAGSNSAEMLLMKPYLWSQTIDSFYLQQAYSLTAAKGVDMRLMEYAREKEIEILNVESGIDQMEMLSGLSDSVQESMLASSISINCADTIYSTEELYEMWCAGDEAELTAYLQEDTSEMSKQELTLYNEYTKAVSTDRNKEMLTVAKNYLESGDTVFYAVGLAHLLVENGLVNTLRDAGYTVELVSYT